MLTDAGLCDGHDLRAGAIVELPPSTEADYVALGLAERVAVPEPETGLETATAPAAETAARKPRRQKRG